MSLIFSAFLQINNYEKVPFASTILSKIWEEMLDGSTADCYVE